MPDTYAYRVLATTKTSEMVVVLERSPNHRRYEYELLATTKTSTLQREVGEAAANGFVLVAMLSRGEHMVVMEKPLP